MRSSTDRAAPYARFFEEPGGHLILDTTYQIVDVGEEYLRLTMTTRDIVGQNLFDIFPDSPLWRDANGVRNLTASLKQVKDDLKPSKMNTQRYDIRRPDGTWEERWWEPTNIPVLVDGQLAYIVHRVFDVTFMVKLEAAVRFLRFQAMLMYAFIVCALIALVALRP